MDRPLIDFLSDTVTVPTAPMRRAMFEAEVGDDCYGEDPTVNELEALAAHMTGKAAAAFVSSGTLGNLTALLAQCPRGHEVILGDQSDLYNYEAGGISLVGGAACCTRWPPPPTAACRSRRCARRSATATTTSARRPP
nr:beta-eliminating lyase-related protein [Burkholderia gladioli]